jgi:hypothetical protein
LATECPRKNQTDLYSKKPKKPIPVERGSCSSVYKTYPKKPATWDSSIGYERDYFHHCRQNEG